jgi:hypothetical protein
LVSFSFYTQGGYKVNILNAFVFLNCGVGTEPNILNEINDILGVSEAVELIGVYDIVSKVGEKSHEDIAKSVRKIRAIVRDHLINGMFSKIIVLPWI